MSYQVLARKWRPRRFEELVGQQHVVRPLVNGLDQGRLHHAFLFSGTRGVGKTTIARILAKSLNCERGVSSHPCGECGTCEEIDAGRFVDLIEVDAASRTKVDDTRELLDNVQYAPTRARYKVYLIDEVHMLSTHSFNALLKTLEEPPPHVKFLLATTDPQRLPVTVLSRCLQFNLKRLDADAIGEFLTRIVDAEALEAEQGALGAIARAADGSVRDALSLLDQAIAHGGGALRETDVRDMLGTIERGYVLDLIGHLAEGDASALVKAVAEFAAQLPDVAVVLDELASALHQVAVAQLVPSALEEAADDPERVRGLAERLAPEDVQLYYDIATKGRRELPQAPDPRTGVEMTLLRMLAFRPASDSGNTGGHRQPERAASAGAPSGAGVAQASEARDAARQAAGATAPADPTGATAASGSGVASRSEPGQAPRTSQQPPSASETEPRSGEGAPQRVQPAGTNASEPAAGPQGSSPATEPSETGPRVEGPTSAEMDWHSTVERLTAKGPAQQLALNAVWLGKDGARVRLALDAQHAHLRTANAEQRLQAALAEHFGEAIELVLSVSETATDTPASRRARRNDARQRDAEASVASDPTVKALQETMDAQIVPNSVRPRADD